MDTPKFITGIDWTDLRTQKTTLLKVINELEMNGNSNADDLISILDLIDALQDYAVDELGIPEMHVFDFELEENREELSKPQVIRCERCNEVLNPAKAVWLELSITDAKYYPPTCFPKTHESQGGFSFGKDCARTVLTKDPENYNKKDI
jgi:hypothetical protein